MSLSLVPLQDLRQQHSKDIEDAMFALTLMGYDRNISATYIYGQCVYEQ